VLTLTGALGSGKTTFTKGIARALGIEDEITSPSFTLVSEYPGRCPLFHIDLYRIDDPDELSFLGLEEYLYDGGVSVVEWGETAEELFPPDRIVVSIAIGPSLSRTISIHEGNA